jgi:hypothetical protein
MMNFDEGTTATATAAATANDSWRKSELSIHIRDIGDTSPKSAEDPVIPLVLLSETTHRRQQAMREFESLLGLGTSSPGPLQASHQNLNHVAAHYEDLALSSSGSLHHAISAAEKFAEQGLAALALQLLQLGESLDHVFKTVESASNDLQRQTEHLNQVRYKYFCEKSQSISFL